MRVNQVLRSTSLRIAAYYALFFGASVGVLFAAVFWSSTEEGMEQIRTTVRGDTAVLLSLYRAQGIEALRLRLLARSERGRLDEDAVYALRDAQGLTLVGDAPFSTFTTGWSEVQVEKPVSSGPDWFGKGRFIMLGTLVNGNVLGVARSWNPVNEIQEVLFHAFGWAGALTVLLALGGGIEMSRKALTRVEAVRLATEEINQGNLTRRLPVIGIGDELDQLSTIINRMLDRIQALMDDLQQVSNDIAHDLRTPLGRLRQRLEAASARTLDAQENRAAFDNAIADVDGILETFAALLRIAQIESGARRASFARFDLSLVATSIAESFEAVAESHGQVLTSKVSPDVTLLGDRELLTQALVNLVENAIRHSPAGARIEVGLTLAGAGPVLMVSDTGPGIPLEELEHVFRRFYRGEKSRSTPGSGLGFALVKAVADLHQAQIELVDNTPGLRVVIRFPKPTPSPAA